jgi:hypothetical protein
LRGIELDLNWNVTRQPFIDILVLTTTAFNEFRESGTKDDTSKPFQPIP